MRIRVLLAFAAGIGIALPVLTILRVPTPFSDVQLYASIARARQLYGVGIPTLTWNSPTAVDHIPFYGPVFFDLSALALRLFGATLFSFRLVSLSGTAVYVAATLWLVHQLTHSRDRVLAAAALVVLTGEVNSGFATGAMHMLAVAFEVLAMAVFVADFDAARTGVREGAIAGALLALAALTTPRSYPLLFAFVCAAILQAAAGPARSAMRWRLGAALIVLGVVIATWAIWSHGSITAWAHYLSYIFTHEDTDVALLPTAVREYSFHWSGVLTPTAALLAGLVAAWLIGRRAALPLKASPGAASPGRIAVLSWLLTCAWIEFVVTAVVLNYTFTIGEYISLPLFSVVVAWPWEEFAIPRRALVVVTAALLLLQSAGLAYRYTCIAATWELRDPRPLNAFIQNHVPPGSVVVGPGEPYFFPVERNGSRYRAMSSRSWADWARWVPLIEPGATGLARQFPEPSSGNRFLVWPTSDEIPFAYRCAAEMRVAAYRAPTVDPAWPDWVKRATATYWGYPSTVLYRLPQGCPSGYDPTRAR